MTQKKHHSDEHRNVIGISFMLLNAVAMAVIYAVAKDLTKEISSNMVVFLYKFGILLFALPWCLNEGFKGLKSDRILLHASRGFLSICGSLCLYYAIKHIELVDITAIGYLEQVILVIIGMAYFKEDVSFAKIIGISLSFLGAIFIVYPDLINLSSINHLPKLAETNEQEAGFNPYYIFVFLSIGFWATNCTVIKILGKTEKTKVQLFYVLLFSSIISFPMAFLRWEEVTTFMSLPIKTPVEFANIDELGLKIEHLKYIAVLAVCYFIHSIAFFKALKYADLSTVIPFDYSRLVFTGILGYLVFSEIPSMGSYVGYILIVSSGVYLVRAEHKRRKKLKESEMIKIEEEYERA